MHRTHTRQNTRQLGLTLAEVLFVTALAILGGLILWFVASRTNDGALTHRCEINVKHLGSAIVMYAYDHDDSMPPYTNLESELAKNTKSHAIPTGSDEPELLRQILRIYSDDPDWFCPTDPVRKQSKYYLGIRHEFTSYAIPAFKDKNGEPLKLSSVPVSERFGLVWDAAGDKSSCEPGLWFAGSKSFASNHPDGYVNFVLVDLSVRHLPALWPGGGILP